MTSEILRQRQRLDALFQQASCFGGDAEPLSHWARYLCVLTSGLMERSLCATFSEYARRHAEPSIARFVALSVEGFQNPKMESIYQLVGKFDPIWEKSLRESSEGELRDAVDSIVTNRHNIAHGRAVGISLVQLRDYHKRALRVLDLIERHFLGSAEDPHH